MMIICLVNLNVLYIFIKALYQAFPHFAEKNEHGVPMQQVIITFFDKFPCNKPRCALSRNGFTGVVHTPPSLVQMGCTRCANLGINSNLGELCALHISILVQLESYTLF